MIPSFLAGGKWPARFWGEKSVRGSRWAWPPVQKLFQGSPSGTIVRGGGQNDFHSPGRRRRVSPPFRIKKGHTAQIAGTTENGGPGGKSYAWMPHEGGEFPLFRLRCQSSGAGRKFLAEHIVDDPTDEQGERRFPDLST